MVGAEDFSEDGRVSQPPEHGHTTEPSAAAPGWPARSVRDALEHVLAEIAAHPDQLQAILTRAPEALIAFDAHRRIRHANRGAEALFGYGEGELDGVSTDTIVPERLRQPDAPAMVATEDIMQIDLPGLRRDGTELPVEWAVGSVRGPSGAVFVMTVRDRDVVDRAFDALRASEERFRLLVGGVREYAIFMLDAEGRVSSWNEGAERNKGWSEPEILGKPYDVLFTPEDRARGVPQQLLAAAVRDGKHEVRGWRVRKDGSRFWASAHLTALRSPAGELRGFAKITRDMTERLKAEEAERQVIAERAGREAAEAAEQRVRDSEARLRQLQRVTAGLSEAATPREVATVVLDQSLQALGASGGAIYLLSSDGTHLELLDQRGHPEDSLAAHARLPLDRRGPLMDAARERTVGFYDSFEACAARYPELRALIRLGEFEASAALPLMTRGALLGVLGVRFRDVRVFSEAEQAMMRTLSELCAQAFERARLFLAERQARADAEAASRAKDEFLAMLGHELRNPLSPIVTALHLMTLRDPDALRHERTVIERQVTHLQRLVDDLLDISRITRGKIQLSRERLELSEVVAKAVELASPLLEHGHHHLAVDVPERGLALHGDATRLAQVVSNLLNNAAKYTPPGGHIAIAAARTGARITLTVRDNGIGISAAMLPRVFELFAQERQSLDRSRGGLGLGLAIARSLVAAHDGTIAVASDGPDQGSVFTVELPAALDEAAAEHVAPPPRRAGSLSGSGRSVLVVDDNVDAAELLGDLLRASGYAVTIAHDGPEALAVAARTRPEVALIDIGLPVMDGYELARKLRDLLGDARLIAVTGYGQQRDRDRSRAAGFDAHLVKPVPLEALHAALELQP
jgi:PAS domain S-box-containing protein